MDADPMTKADPIPLPSETDINIDLVGIWLSARAHHDYSNAYYTENIKFYRDIEALCRRCHAAESEVARLRGENAEYHAELCRERTALEVEQVSHQSTLNLAAAQDAAAEQRIAILTAERDLARSNYEITHRNYAELNDWVTDYSTDERIAECVRLRAERDAALAAAREAASSGMRRSKFSAP